MNKFTVGIIAAVILLLGFLLLSSPSEDKQDADKAQTVSRLQDAHGLAVDRKDSSKVYIAAHTGLLVMNNDGELQQIGNARNDYMGFSAHPTNPNTFYTSGHPRSGGNLGFQKSTDGGKTWQKIANGVNGPVDFHAMTVSQADPTIVYGYYGGQLQRSRDEGETWEIVDTNVGNIIVLATDFRSKDRVYAGTTDGIYMSQNQGDTWSKIEAVNGVVTALAVNPENDQEITAYVQSQGLMRSPDAGESWDTLSGDTSSMVMHLAYDVQKPATMYLINQRLEIHKTTNEGKTWIKVR